MLEPTVNPAAYCINPDCRRPVIRSSTAHNCPTCKTTLRLGDRFIPLAPITSNRYTATYRAYDLSSKTDVILKVLLDSHPQAEEHFRYTAKVLSSMRCPGLPRVGVKNFFWVPLGESVQSLPCFVMEQIEGKSFEAIVREHPKGCPEGWVVAWLQKILEALHFLHSRQVIHGNLSLDNIVLQEEIDQPVLLGVGHLRAELTAAIAGQRLDESVDLMALGRIAIHLLTGMHPLDLTDDRTGRLRWRNRARVSSVLADLLDRLVQPLVSDPSDRGYVAPPQTALEVKTALIEWAEKQERQWKKPHIHRPTAHKPLKKHRHKQGRSRPRAKSHPVTVMQDVRVGNTATSPVATQLAGVAQLMVNVVVTSAIATILSVGVIIYSPLSPIIYAGFSGLARSLPLGTWMEAVNPALLVFLLVGVGTQWGMMQGSAHEQPLRSPSAWVAGLGYAISWLAWQGVGAERPLQALLRMSAIAAIFFVLQVGSLPLMLVQGLITTFGTSLTMLLLLRSQIIQPVKVLAFLSQTNAIQPGFDAAMLMLTVVFFAGLGATIAGWLGISQWLVLPEIKRWLGDRP